MKAFARLYADLDASGSTSHKVGSMVRYLREAPPADAAWATYFLAGGKPRQIVPARLLREAAREVSGLPEWLVDESYSSVGDLAETIAHLLPEGQACESLGLSQWMEERLLPLRGAPAEVGIEALKTWWSQLDWNGRFALNKLITGGFRVGVSKQLVVRALAEVAGLEATLIAQRMIGYTDARRMPDAQRYLALIEPVVEGVAVLAPGGQPYPFFLAHPLQGEVASLGAVQDWQVEWKWDGIRAQLVMRGEQVWLWSRGEELITERFPEIERAARQLVEGLGLVRPALDGPLRDGLVLDGEVLAWDVARSRPLPFAALQRRITRKTLTAAIARDAPAVFVAYDLLESAGQDWRDRPLAERRSQLERVLGRTAGEGAAICEPDPTVAPTVLVAPTAPQAATSDRMPTGVLRVSPVLAASDWPELAALRESSRERGVEGFMLKRRSSLYGIGRPRTEGVDWWKWKVEPYSIDAVLVYAQRGHGRRASLYTDYTFALWSRAAGEGTEPPALLPFAKAYSGLSDDEIAQVDAVIRRTVIEKFGPVRSVTPTMVFELGFEGISRSPRHKSGVAVRFPRILRWRTDKTVDQANTLADLHALLGSTP
jgi:DNA ligase-1